MVVGLAGPSVGCPKKAASECEIFVGGEGGWRQGGIFRCCPLLG